MYTYVYMYFNYLQPSNIKHFETQPRCLCPDLDLGDGESCNATEEFVQRVGRDAWKQQKQRGHLMT